MIYVKPAPGGRVRMPERRSKVMAAEGARVPRNDYYERLLLTGDVVLSEEPQSKPSVHDEQRAEAKRKPSKHEPHTSAGFTRSAKES